MGRGSFLNTLADRWYLFLVIPLGLWSVYFLIIRVAGTIREGLENKHETPGENNPDKPEGLSPAKAESLAEQVYAGMSYSWVSDNYEQTALGIESLENSRQFNDLRDAFGIRQEYNFGVPTGQKVGMMAMMSRELPKSKKGRVNRHLSKIDVNEKVK